MRTAFFITAIVLLGVRAFLAFRVFPHYLDSEPMEYGVCGTQDNYDAYPLPDQPEALVLFKSNCARCHSTNFYVESTGPALANVGDRVPSSKWVFEFLRAPTDMLESGDLYMEMLVKEHSGQVHPSFPHLSDEKVQMLADFILG